MATRELQWDGRETYVVDAEAFDVLVLATEGKPTREAVEAIKEYWTETDFPRLTPLMLLVLINRARGQGSTENR